MSRKMKLIIGGVLAGIGVISVVWFVGTHDIAVLNPEGLIGQQQRDLLIITTILILLVVVPVFVMTFTIAWKYRAGNEKAKYTPEWDHHPLLETIWWGVPIAIILVLAVITWKSSHDLDPYRPLASDVKPLRVQVIALQWKWLFLYPDHRVASVNHLQIPEGTPINFEITADAPMNAFWIPKLGSQVYAMAGMTTKLHLIANHQGSYRGSSANISGEGFADMSFMAHARSSADFEGWVRQTRLDADGLTSEAYNVLASPRTAGKIQSFTLHDTGLYDRVIMKYMAPADTSPSDNEHMHTADHDEH